ncbi:MAG: hypothetical protein M1823_002905 [Watsoniomyces obsoletus]|nr:MAG: hypothetical protein M1823_002905 [Watsoniomyces obsoletus]
MLRTGVLRASHRRPATTLHTNAIRRPPTCLAVSQHLPQQQQQRRHEHAISNPTLAGIEKRWEEMQPQDQAELWMQLRDRMKTDWHELTWQEKKASYWIAFGPHGPRAVAPPGENWRVFYATMLGVGIAIVIFAIQRQFAKPGPSTMTREWQEASNELMKAQKTEPITGVSSEGYTGKGLVQSRPAGK